MVLAAAALDTAGSRALSRAGLRDSKSYGAGAAAVAKRAELAAEVRKRALYVQVRVVDVCEIDRRVQKKQLNMLEQEVARDLIDAAPQVHRIVADGKRLFSCLCADYEHLEALDQGESRHAAVAAASVLAKHRRDQIFDRIAQRYQPLFGELRGGGYGNNKTREFLRAYAERFGKLPPEARRSWPYTYLDDILGAGFDPFADCPDQKAGQLELL